LDLDEIQLQDKSDIAQLDDDKKTKEKIDSPQADKNSQDLNIKKKKQLVKDPKGSKNKNSSCAACCIIF
jgi:hypothetical protein